MTSIVRRSPLPLLLAVALAVAVGRADSTPAQLGLPNNTGAISGVVTDGVTKRPIAGATVAMSAGRTQVSGPSRQMTDERGRFVFANLPPAESYTLNATKFGYFDSGYGQTPGGSSASSIVIGTGTWFANANVELLPLAAISGVATDATGQPVVGAYVRALVEISAAGARQLAMAVTTTTDDRGMYRLAGLQSGTYIVQMPFTQATVPRSMSIAALAGLTDEAAAIAERAGRAIVQSPAVDVDGSQRVVLNRFPVPPATTDGRLTAYATQFYPGARSLTSATPVMLGRGESKASIDFRLEAAPTWRVSGRLDGPPPADLNGVPLRLYLAGTDSLGTGGEAATTTSNPDGSFVFPVVPAGEYVLDAHRLQTGFRLVTNSFVSMGSAFAPMPGAGFTGQSLMSLASGVFVDARPSVGSQEWAGRTRVAVTNSDLQNVGMTLRRSGHIAGDIRYDMATPAAIPYSQTSVGLAVSVDPANGSAMLGMPRMTLEDGEMSGPFFLGGLLGGEYFLRPQTPNAFALKSIVWNGRDYTNKPFDTSNGQNIDGVVVTFTNATTELSGTVRTNDGGPQFDAAVIVFPAERDQWSNYGLLPLRIKTARVNSAGAFRFVNLPAGAYLAVAVDQSRIMAWQDPAFLEAAASPATRVTLRWTEKTTQDLRLVVVR